MADERRIRRFAHLVQYAQPGRFLVVPDGDDENAYPHWSEPLTEPGQIMAFDGVNISATTVVEAASAAGSSLATQDYVNSAVASGIFGSGTLAFVDAAGDTMSGPLLQPNAPTSSGALTNRQYVDDRDVAVLASAQSYGDVTFSALGHGHSLSDLGQSSASTGQVVTWSGSAWIASSVVAGVQLSDINTWTGQNTFNEPVLLDTTYLRGTNTSASDILIRSQLYGDGNIRCIHRADGTIELGDGTSPVDTNLYRSGVGQLKTDGNFYALGLHTSQVDIGANLNIHDGAYFFAYDGGAADNVMIIRAYGSANHSFRMKYDGSILIGDGTSAPDTTIQRLASASLGTNGRLTANAGLASETYIGSVGGVAGIQFGAGGTNWYKAAGDLLRSDGAIEVAHGVELLKSGPIYTLSFFGAAGSAQATSIPDASGGIVSDSEARTAINDLLAALRAYGIIAT